MTAAALVAGIVVIASAVRRLQETMASHASALTAMTVTADRFRSMVEDATDLVILVSDDAVEYASPSTARFFDCSPDDLVGRQLSDFIHEDDRKMAASGLLAGDTGMVRNQRLVELRMRNQGESWLVLEGSARVLNPGPDGVARSVLNLRDITERRRLEHELAHRASHDTVSGLANRAYFRIQTQKALRRQNQQHATSMIYIHLNDFQRVENSLGQRAADATIREVATRIEATIGEDCLAARLGDATFAVLGEHTRDVDCGAQTEAILDSISHGIELPEGVVGITGTAGCVVLEAGLSIDQVQARAEVALEEAERRGLRRVAYDPERHTHALTVRELEHEIDEGLERAEFRVHYQPLVDLLTQEVLGFEALVRWQHPTRGIVSPGDFIPAAERSGAIIGLGRWVMQESCRALARLQEAFPREAPLYVTVNVAAQQLATADLVTDVREAIATTGIAPGTLTIEITESSLVDNVEQAVMMLQALRDLGCKIAIDDFGTGYSSLSQLQQFPLDILKVDRAFVHGLRVGDRNTAVTEAIVSLSKRLELRTVAEGIENADDLDTVMALSCNIGQGYFFGRPADEEQAVATLQQRLADLELATRLALRTPTTN